MKWGRSYRLWFNTTDTFAILVKCVQNAIWDERTLPSGLICGSSMQQYPFPRPVSSESMFSFWLSGLCLFTWHVTCFAIINLAPPIAALHHRKTTGSGERCLNPIKLVTKPEFTKNFSAKQSNAENNLHCSVQRHFTPFDRMVLFSACLKEKRIVQVTPPNQMRALDLSMVKQWLSFLAFFASSVIVILLFYQNHLYLATV